MLNESLKLTGNERDVFLTEMEKKLGRIQLLHCFANPIEETETITIGRISKEVERTRNFRVGDSLDQVQNWNGFTLKAADEETSRNRLGVLFTAHYDRAWSARSNALTTFEGPLEHGPVSLGIFIAGCSEGRVDDLIKYIKEVVGPVECQVVEVVIPKSPELHSNRMEDEPLQTRSSKERISHVMGNELKIHEFTNKLRALRNSERQDLYTRLEIQKITGWLETGGRDLICEIQEIADCMFGETANMLRAWSEKRVGDLPWGIKNPFGEESKVPVGYILENSWIQLQRLTEKPEPSIWDDKDKMFTELGLAVLIKLATQQKSLEIVLWEANNQQIYDYYSHNPTAPLEDFQKRMGFWPKRDLVKENS